MGIPKFAAFRSIHNQKYLNYVSSDDSKIPNFVQYSSENVALAPTKFSIQVSNSGTNLFHIRCIYNQKYLRAESSSSRWICATSLEPNEDQSNWACTLFRITFNNTSSEPGYELFHMYYGQPVDLNTDSASYPNCLYIFPDDTYNIYKHTILDWELMILLPQHVVFKGDNNLYLKIHGQDSHDYLRFLQSDPHDASVQHEVVVSNDGNLRLKGPNGKFWRAVSNNWIWIDSTNTTSNDKATVFKPYKLLSNDDKNKNTFVLRNMGGNNFFCKRLTSDGKVDCFSANDPAMSKYTKLTVEEAVISRDIYNVVYRLSDGRIYGESIVALDFQGASNGSNETNIMGFTFSYEEEASQCWSSIVGMKLDYSMTIDAKIPLIVEANIELSGSTSGAYTWGQTNKQTNPKKTPYSLEVLPRTSVKVSIIATKGYCDVPFSYTQGDVLVNGETRITDHDDGLYTGLNCYNFRYHAEDVEPLSTTTV